MVQRLTISLDDDIAAALDSYMSRRGVSNRSEAMRDLIRDALSARDDRADGACVAAVSYVYNHHERSLAERLTERHHRHHDLVVATMHAHLDHDHCLELVIMKGQRQVVRHVADQTITERGVRFGQVNLVPLKHRADDHDHGAGHHHHLTPEL